MKIDSIIGMFVFTDNGKRLSVKEFVNTPRVGNEIKFINNMYGMYESIPQGDSSDCPSGVCPVK